MLGALFFFFSSRRRHTRCSRDWSSDVCSSDLVSVGANYTGTMRNEPASFPPGDTAAQSVPTTTLLKYWMPAYTTVDAAVGVAKDNWTVEFSASNLTNNDASTNTSSGQFIKTEFPLRPRVLTLNFGIKF